MGKLDPWPGLAEIDGAIDCTHIKIVGTPGCNYHEVFRNRKSYFSLNVQGAVVGPNIEFLDIVARWAGSIHDSRIFRMSAVYQKYNQGILSGRLVGDSGYPSLPFLLTPIGSSPLDPPSERYNRTHIKTRNVVERTFGVLKKRFPCLIIAKLKYYDFCCTARCEVSVTKAGRNSQVRARESSVERSQRLAQQNLRTSELRVRESRLERSQRLHEQNIRTSDLREQESSVERSQRLAEQNLRTSELRAQESRLERSQHLHEQNIRTSQLRERESSVERLQRLRAQAERQQLSTNRVRNRILANSNRLAFRYDPQVDYAQQAFVQIGVMNKICSNCSAKKWVDESNDMCCASDRTPQIAHRGRYNALTVNEVAVLLVDEDKGPRDIVLHGRDGQLKRVSELHRSYDPLQYPIMFVTGEDGYYLTIPQQGSARNKTTEKTQDEMTYVQNYGRPDLFVTFTCNPEWPEIKAELLPGQRSFDRHDIISRVFHLKIKKFIKLFVEEQIFGKVKCYVASVEWQKRGLPHCYLLFWLETKIQPDEIDSVIVAELPDQEIDPVLHDIITKNMVHGPCGEHNLAAPCMKNDVCTKKYPLRFMNDTQTGEDGIQFIVGAIQEMAVGALRYKSGATWYISTSEADWRLFEFPVHDRHPTVVHLAVHLENGQRVYFTTGIAHQVVQNPRHTTLLAFFAFCNENEFAKTLLYREVPQYYTWVNNKFTRRRRGEDVVGHPGIKKDAALGRVYEIHPSQSECFYLRILLDHVRGPTSFAYLKTVNGFVKETYQAACRDRGLLENDDHWEVQKRTRTRIFCRSATDAHWCVRNSVLHRDLEHPIISKYTKDASKRFFDIAESHPNALLRAAVDYEPPPPSHFIRRPRSVFKDPPDALTAAVESLNDVNDTHD
ncbi:Protein ALP1-like [Eumeta japonica]|uniref:Protein ALP1-like n=1 Tax=Eumeta variegata TaxID=151549 RepID=A0A4C1UBP3_EUMVA|nr:Protein ALP1-like [Eumeta japonica]